MYEVIDSVGHVTKMGKVVRDGKVAVLYSPGFGAGWSTWARDEIVNKILFSPEIVYLVENNRREEITQEYCEQMFGTFMYAGGARDLQIVWMDEGQQFKVNEYDGSESIEYADKDYWSVA